MMTHPMVNCMICAFMLTSTAWPAYAADPAPPMQPPANANNWLGASIEDLTPLPNGPGLVVCEPATAPDALQNFGSGCSRWLQLNVGGQPQLSRSPSWPGIYRAIQELGTDNLRLPPATASKLGGILGITHAATAKISGTPTSCTLTYQLWQVPALKPVGTPLAAHGSETQVLRQLPQLASRMLSLLGIKPAEPIPALALSSGDTSFIGSLPWLPNDIIRMADCQRLYQCADKSALAAMLYLMSPACVRSRPEWAALAGEAYFLSDEPEGAVGEATARKVVQSLLQRQPQNSTIITAMTSRNVDAGVLSRDLAQYPNNVRFLWMQIVIDEDANRVASSQQYAQRLARVDATDPEAWDALANLVYQKAKLVRQGAYWGDLNATQKELVRRLYVLYRKAANRSVQLDPLYGGGWLELSQADAFDDDLDEAQDAYWKAAKLDLGDTDLYGWGHQLFQPKWIAGKTPELVTVANLEAKDQALGPLDGLQEELGLYKQGYRDQARALSQMLIPVFKHLVDVNPDDALYCHGLAYVLEGAGHLDESVQEMRTVMKLTPKDCLAVAHLGVVLMKEGSYDAAARAEGDALALAQAPTHNNPGAGGIFDYTEPSMIRYYLAYALMLAGKLDEAEKDLRADFNSPVAHVHICYGLAEVLFRKHQFDDAIKQYKYVLDNWNNEIICVRLAECYCQASQFDEAQKLLQQELNQQPDDGYAHIVLAAALRHASPPASILKLAMPPF